MTRADISHRARKWRALDPYLVRTHFRCASDHFDPERNPTGYVNFGTAENYEVFDAIEPLLRESSEIFQEDAHYGPLHGSRELRDAIASFLSARAGRELSPDNLAVASGASAILEILAFVLCDPGDGILIPTPYYPGFDHDLGLRSEAELLPVPLESPDFELTVGAVERAFADATRGDTRVAALLLNSPHNPLGQIYHETLIREIVEFATQHEIHVILDEIYAESLLPGAHHFTGLRIENPFVHVVYGVAKDFGLSGYKIGILHSENSEVISAVQGSAYFHVVSLLPQRVLAGVFRSPRLPGFLSAMRERLASSHHETTNTLSEAGISCVPSRGGIVLWLDLRQFLRAPSFEAERELAEEILDASRVNISPGNEFRCHEPGWFRLCFTVSPAHRSEGLCRLIEHLTADKSSSPS